MTTPNLDYTSTKVKTPTLVLVLSIITIAWGIFGILCSVIGTILTTFTNILSFGAPNPAAEIIQHDTLAEAVTIITITLSCFAFLFSILAAAGALKLRPWGRWGMNLFALWLLLSTLFSCLFNAIYMAPRVAQLTDVHTPGTYTFTLATQLVGVAVGFLFIVAYTTLLLFAFNTRKTRNAFKGIFTPETHPAEIPPELRNSPLI